MNLRKFIATALAVFAALYVVAHCHGCSPAEMKRDAAASGYEAQQMRCVEQYAHKADIDRCRMKVKLAWATVDAGSDG